MNYTYFNQSAEKVNSCTGNFNQERKEAADQREPNADASASLAEAFAQADLIDRAEDGDFSAVVELDELFACQGLELLTETPKTPINTPTAGINTDNQSFFSSPDGQTACLVYGSLPSDVLTRFEGWLADLDEQDVKHLDVELACRYWRFSRARGGNYGYFAQLAGSGITLSFCRNPGKTSGAEIPLCKVVFGWQVANSCNLADVMRRVFEYLQILGCSGLRYHITRLDLQYTTNRFELRTIEQAIQGNATATHCRNFHRIGPDIEQAETYFWKSSKSGWALRIYNKTLEMLAKNDAAKLEYYWNLLGTDPLIRFEFELNRDFLRTNGVTTFDDLYSHWQTLLTYIFAHCVRFLDRDKAGHVERAKPAAWWVQIHSNWVVAADGQEELQRRSKPQIAVKLDNHSKQVFTSSAAAFLAKLVASDAAYNETSFETAFYNLVTRIKTSVMARADEITQTAAVEWSGLSEFDQFAS